MSVGAHRISVRLPALLVLAWLLALPIGCPTTTEYVGADPADELNSESSANREALTLYPYMASEPLKLYYSDSDPYSMLLFPALRFDLGPIPEGAVIRRAALRLRRSVVTWGGSEEPPTNLSIEVIDVNTGLRIYDIQTVREVLTIERASRTEHEDDVWVEIASDIGPSTPTIELASAVYRGRMYVDLLERWNASVTQDMVTSGAWDELDVTEFVQSESQGDGSLTLLLRSPEDEVTLEWYGIDDTSVDDPALDPAHLRPRLIIEYDFGEGTGLPADLVDEVVAAPTVEPPVPEVAPTPARTTVTFTSEPSGARIYIDDAFVGTTIEGEQVEIPLTEASVSVRMVVPGYLPWEETLRLFPGSQQYIHAVLQPEP